MNQNDELLHYGIKGQKWGIRRYQNPDGTLTAEGRKRAKQEYRADNKEAYELGKQATDFGKAAVYATNKAIKAREKALKAREKDPNGLKGSTRYKQYRANISDMNAKILIRDYKKAKDMAEKHCQDLIEKYGKEAIKGIKYKEATKLNKNVRESAEKIAGKKIMLVNEKNQKLGDYILRGIFALESLGLSELSGTARPEVGIYDSQNRLTNIALSRGVSPENLTLLKSRMMNTPDEYVSGSYKHVH